VEQLNSKEGIRLIVNFTKFIKKIVEIISLNLVNFIQVKYSDHFLKSLNFPQKTNMAVQLIIMEISHFQLN